MSTGTYSITIYCGYSLDFIIGYFKAFSNAIFNFDSYGISIDFSDDNSKTFSNDVYSFESYGVLLVLVLTILRLLIALLLGFVWIVKGCLWGPPYTTAPPCNAWGNAPVDDS